MGEKLSHTEHEANHVDPEKVRRYANSLVTSAEARRRQELPESLSDSVKLAILDTLIEQGAEAAVRLNIGEFLRIDKASLELYTEKCMKLGWSGVVAEIASRLPSEQAATWIKRLVDADFYDDVTNLLQSPNISNNKVPGIVADKLAAHDKIRAIVKNMGKFKDGEVSEDVAIQLINMGNGVGNEFVSAVVGYFSKFSSLGKRTFDALVAESRLLISVIAYNLSKFRGLPASAEGTLREAGFGKEVDANPNSFENNS